MNKFSVRVLNKFGLLNYLSVNGSIVLNNQKFKIPIIQKTGFNNMFISEPWMIDLLKIVLEIDNRGFVDIGVNVGQTLLKLKSVSKNIKYFGFEPNPLCIYYVDKLIKENKIINCQLIPVGISNSIDIVELNFYSDSITDSTASIIQNFRPEQNIIRKEFVPIFEVEQIKEKVGLNDYSVLKIDVEGAELEVIKSFLPSIMKNNPIILIEILPAYNDNNTYRINRQSEIITLLHNLDYSFFRVIKQNDKLIGLLEINDIEIHSDLNNCEYLMAPNNKKERIKKNTAKNGYKI